MVEGKEYELKDVLCEKEIRNIIEELTGNKDYNLLGTELKAANESLIGFLGEHLRATLQIKIQDNTTYVNLFIKRLPHTKDNRRAYIEDKKFFQREIVILNIYKEFDGSNGSKPCCCRPLLCKENLIVMPDLGADGYKIRSTQNYFDLQHTLLAAASVARFHADYANYETLKSVIAKHPYTILQDHYEVLKEVVHIDSPWLIAAEKTAFSYVREYSKKNFDKIQDLEEKFHKIMLQTCDILTEYKDSLNVVLHKDLWNNNIMFKYTNDQPTNAVLVDFQLARYGPPAFDIMIMLYLNTSRSFREQHEQKVFQHYYSIFLETISSSTKERLRKLKYDYDQFRKWCELSRVYGILVAICNLPYVAMDGAAAQQSLADPENFGEYFNQDITKPVLAYARKNTVYQQRLLEVYEEFIERFVM